MSLLQNSNAIETLGYTIERSLRFQSASSQYLSRTPASAGNRQTFTWSGWVKRGDVTTASNKIIFGTNAGFEGMYFDDSNGGFRIQSTAGTTYDLATTQVFRDPSAWYHLVLAIDTTQATASNRIKIYVNGTQVTAFRLATYPALNGNTGYNNTIIQYIGGTQYFDGYLSEVNFIDGQALTPSSFGETDALTGVWVAKRYTGTYGTNGFYLKFNDGTSTTTLGQDRSGNANNWTLTNFTRSAGVSDCWMYDVPSGNGSPSATQPSSNYAVINPLNLASSGVTSTNANLLATSTGAAYRSLTSTIDLPTGSWYFEITAGTNSAGDNVMVGIQSVTENLQSNYVGSSATSYGYGSGGKKYNAGTGVAYGATWTAGDVIGIAFNGSTLTFYKNNTSQGNAYTGLSGNFVFVVSAYNSSASVNFGQRSFAYTPPSGFKALCTANLPAPTIAKGNQYMDATLYTGNATARSITNAAGFSPEFVWIKERSSTSSHQLFDVVRGATKNLESNTTSAEGTFAQTLTSFNADGFSLGTDSAVNENTQTYVGWQWDAGTSTVTNTSGSISSQVRASTTSGVSIVTWTGTGANATIGHGLGVAPSMIIVKYRNSTGNWQVYHSALGNTRFVQLNTTIASTVESTMWNNTSPTSSVFTTGTNFGSLNMVAYCFAEIAGFSKFGSYTGNGSTDGPFVYLGFRPKFVMVKIYSGTTGDWAIFDTSRSTYNEEKLVLWPNLSIAESTGSNGIDGLANGFKIRSASNYINGTSSYSYIYMAFAETPFNFSNSR